MKKELLLLYHLIVGIIPMTRSFTTTTRRNGISYYISNDCNRYNDFYVNPYEDNNKRDAVVLKMGLRSFLKKRFTKGNDNSNNNMDEEEEDYWDKIRKETLSSTKQLPDASTAAPILESPEYDYKESNNDEDDEYVRYQGGESVEERIARIKAGGMTEDEKQAFLQTALDRTVKNDGEGNTGPPIRQQVSINKNSNTISDTMWDSNYSSSKNEGQEEGAKASPFPKDALWNSIAGNNKVSRYEDVGVPGVGSTSANDLLLEGDEAKKREWFNMVTNPDRFKSFSALNRDSSSTSGADATPPPQQQQTNDDVSDLPITTENTPQQPSESPVITATTADSNTLSSRLEQAAILQTKQANEKREQNERRRAETEAQYLVDQERINAVRRQREEAVVAKERQLKEKKLAQQEAIRKQAEERKKNQLEQVRLLQLKQDEYWSKKIDNDREMREAKMSTKEKEEHQMEQMKIKDQEQVRIQQEQQQLYNVQKTRLEDRTHEPRAESQVLDQAKVSRERAKEIARQTLEASAAKVIQQEKQRTELLQQQLQAKQTRPAMDWSKLKNPMASVPSATPPPPPVTKRLDLRELTQYNPNSPNNPPQTNIPIRQTIASIETQQKQPNKPIRMKLPISEEEDETDSTPLPKKENDEKKRASQWGINLDLLK